MNLDKVKIYLCAPNKEKICVLNGINYSSVSLTTNASDLFELSFQVNQYINIDGKTILSNGYEHLKSQMYLYLEGTTRGEGYYKFTSEPSISFDGDKELLNLKANSVDCEFMQKDLVDFFINTGNPDSYEYLYDENMDSIIMPELIILKNLNCLYCI